MKRLSILAALPLAALLAVGSGTAQDRPQLTSSDDAARALADARAQGEAAGRRAQLLEKSAAGALAAVEGTAREGAILAARIQQSEARIAESQARLTLIERDLAALRRQLASKQRPLIELTAALQRISRRPPILSLLRPGSLEDAVYLRAVLESMLPEIERRTAVLRSDLRRSRTLEAQARQTVGTLRAGRGELEQRRAALVALETRQRLASRAASGAADREAERALALAEQARDLGALVGELGKASELRERLAALPGPVLRPASPSSAEVAVPPPSAPGQRAPNRYLLPTAGRLVAGFGESVAGGQASQGIAIAAPGSALAIAPAGGRVAFAGPYKGYGNIVIIEHGGGWASLVTGLVRLDTRVGERLVAGSPLGQAGPGRPVVTFELRRNGEPVNPLDYLAR